MTRERAPAAPPATRRSNVIGSGDADDGEPPAAAPESPPASPVRPGTILSTARRPRRVAHWRWRGAGGRQSAHFGRRRRHPRPRAPIGLDNQFAHPRQRHSRWRAGGGDRSRARFNRPEALVRVEPRREEGVEREGRGRRALGREARLAARGDLLPDVARETTRDRRRVPTAPATGPAREDAIGSFEHSEPAGPPPRPSARAA